MGYLDNRLKVVHRCCRACQFTDDLQRVALCPCFLRRNTKPPVRPRHLKLALEMKITAKIFVSQLKTRSGLEKDTNMLVSMFWHQTWLLNTDSIEMIEIPRKTRGHQA